jgi:ribonucleoside-diphosphate reductase alpha chain
MPVLSGKDLLSKSDCHDMSDPIHVIKRNGTAVPFDRQRISNAIIKAIRATNDQAGTQIPNQNPILIAEELTTAVIKQLKSRVLFPVDSHSGLKPPSVEQIQDTVEKVLMAREQFRDVAKQYILYRNTHQQERKSRKAVTEDIRKLYDESKKFFPSIYEYVIYLRTYARWLPDKGRRETWLETIERFMAFMRKQIGNKLNEQEYKTLETLITRMDIMPSMRLLQCAGPAAERENMCIYNCCYIAPECFKDLVDIMYCSMNGTGVGFSVEANHVNKFPVITTVDDDKGLSISNSTITDAKVPVYKIVDSKEGWCDSLLKGLETWYAGQDIKFDYSAIRAKGSRLTVMGGRASGPEPLKELLDFTRTIIRGNAGKRLTPIHVHDIICKIGQIVVAGSTRRSALISLSDLNDPVMRAAKSGSFWEANGQRSMANNSAVYAVQPSVDDFTAEWKSLVESRSGERGIFNRSALKQQLPERRSKLLGDRINQLGTNPCGEILLQSHGLCNLSTIVCRPDDTKESLKNKIYWATILGTYQATLTQFKYVSPKFQQRAEEERLLGVSMTGQFDCPAARDPRVLSMLRDHAIETNVVFAARFGIPRAAAVTAIKPEGTVSEMVGASPGMHPRYAKNYIRRVRMASHDPLLKLLRDQGLVVKPEIGQTADKATTFVVEFPKQAPETSVIQDSMSAIDMLNHWLMNKLHYTEHNPSCSIYYADSEVDKVRDFVLDNWNKVGGLSFFPKDGSIYALAPIEPISKQQYDQQAAEVEKLKLDLSRLVYYEIDDTHVDARREAACAGGQCLYSH